MFVGIGPSWRSADETTHASHRSAESDVCPVLPARTTVRRIREESAHALLGATRGAGVPKA